MLNSGKKIRASRDKKNKYSNSCVVRKKNSERNKKPFHFTDLGTTQCSLSFAHNKYNACIQIEAMTINKMNNYIIMNHINHNSDIILDVL